MASRVAQGTAPKKGQRIHAKVSMTSMTSNTKSVVFEPAHSDVTRIDGERSRIIGGPRFSRSGRLASSQALLWHQYLDWTYAFSPSNSIQPLPIIPDGSTDSRKKKVGLSTTPAFAIVFLRSSEATKSLAFAVSFVVKKITSSLGSSDK